MNCGEGCLVTLKGFTLVFLRMSKKYIRLTIKPNAFNNEPLWTA